MKRPDILSGEMAIHHWRAMNETDIARASEIERSAHPDYQEGKAIIANRLQIFPHGCLIFQVDGIAYGYMLCHPWTRGKPVDLNTAITSTPHDADCLYIHDLAMSTDVCGTGAGRSAIPVACDLALAKGLHTLAIVALPLAMTFWERRGFVAAAITDGSNLESKYGSDAQYMELQI